MIQNVDVQGNKPLRFATFILVLLVIAGVVIVWHLYPLLPDPLVLGPEKEEGPRRYYCGQNLEAASYGQVFNRLRRYFSSPAEGGNTSCPKGANSIYN